jgi:hypothetical protein
MSGCAHPSKRSITVIAASLLSLAVLCGPPRMGQAAVDAARSWPHEVTAALIAARGKPDRPVLAFYYMWYKRTSWSARTMSDLPTLRYDSADDATISRQITWAANAGITGFIGSWWGPGDPTDRNFSRLLARSALLEKTAGYHFASAIYLESDGPAFSGADAIAGALRYVLTRYGASRYFFHWHGKPVIFIWDPLGQGRTLAQWAATMRARSCAERCLSMVLAARSSRRACSSKLLISDCVKAMAPSPPPVCGVRVRALIVVVRRARLRHGPDRGWNAGHKRTAPRPFVAL